MKDAAGAVFIIMRRSVLRRMASCWRSGYEKRLLCSSPSWPGEVDAAHLAVNDESGTAPRSFYLSG